MLKTAGSWIFKLLVVGVAFVVVTKVWAYADKTLDAGGRFS